ncbi:hypothetical protein HMPREF0281_01096 [Corynebacterium ammoniagenes DSM 20306]|uniref:Uncharacterized protein n=1 Tax=Corynebacterium ammoniagenes DSM 20306 TaxID=649754 RepID=A0ABN0AFY7_CORAM|nr:hypothetical protein HMPREF0281_01096 [Corynebacterium ammoniagenes DSM 20306]
MSRSLPEKEHEDHPEARTPQSSQITGTTPSFSTIFKILHHYYLHL